MRPRARLKCLMAARDELAMKARVTDGWFRRNGLGVETRKMAVSGHTGSHVSFYFGGRRYKLAKSGEKSEGRELIRSYVLPVSLQSPP